MAAEYFGTEEQVALLRRGAAAFALLGGDARYGYYGRTVGLATPRDGGLERLRALATLQGATNYAAVPDGEADALADGIEAAGLRVTRYRRWTGGAAAFAAAARLLERAAPPADVQVLTIDAATPAPVLAALAETALGVGVLPVAGAVLRGAARPAVCLAAVERGGGVAACAAAAAMVSPAHATLGGQFWWGMLATRPDRRGAGLALRLGAMALLAMRARHGLEEAFTGVQPGNAASEAVCARLGLAPEPAQVLTAVDPAALGGGGLTR